MGIVASTVSVLLVLGIKEVVYTERKAQGLTATKGLGEACLEPEEMVGGGAIRKVGAPIEAVLSVDEEMAHSQFTLPVLREV